MWPDEQDCDEFKGTSAETEEMKTLERSGKKNLYFLV